MVQKIKDKTRWGDWWLAADTMHLCLSRGGNPERYYIPLKAITDSAHMLDWIFQLRAKTWVTNDIMGDLLSAFEEIFDPQDTLCGTGRDKKLDADKHLANRIAS